MDNRLPKYDKDGVNINNAPDGFYATLKAYARTPNICASCDARPICQTANNDWYIKYRCMSDPMLSTIDGKTYSRPDGKSVMYKRLPDNP